MNTPVEVVRRALALHAERLIRLPNVVGLGVALRASEHEGPDHCLAVYVSRKLPLELLAEHERVPPSVGIEGVAVRTRVVETGRFERDSGGTFPRPAAPPPPDGPG
ncbi:hypothetical protein WI372_17010 [Gemmatimonadota bacterium DH-20]|uniref:Uncharacterized protein n=1 Tax=Gaopeijia maritima TaxID=3119007 RepID=A0ABU9ED99_9BACT